MSEDAMGMRRARVLGEMPRNYYHVVSRVVDRQFVFGDAEKRHFRHLVRKLLKFSGLRCITYCVMDNHFHLLLEVPDDEGQLFRAEAPPEEILGRVAQLYDSVEFAKIREHYEMLRSAGGGGAADAYLETFRRRMYDLGVFVKELKGTFTQWYNRRIGRDGTLWESRYRSVLCEGSREVLLTVAAYIDLNPVRAGIVSDPMDYRWSGYGEAVGGDKISREGLVRAYDLDAPVAHAWRVVQTGYRMLLYGAGWEKTDEAGRSIRRGLSEEAIRKVMGGGGELTRAQLLRCRLRYLSDGMVIGSKEFLEAFFRSQRWRFGKGRTSGARRMVGGDWGEMMAMRDLQVDAIALDPRDGGEKKPAS